MRKPKPTRQRLLQPPKQLSCACPRSAAMEVSIEEPQKKDNLLSTASGASIDGPFMTQDTSKCRRFSKDGSLKDKPTKPFNSAKKTWKKTGNGDSSQVAYLMERLITL